MADQIPLTGRPTKANIFNNTLYLEPIPDKSLTCEIEYWEIPTKFIDDTDTSGIAVEFNELIVMATKYLVARELGKFNEANVLEAEYEAEKIRALQHWNRKQGIEPSEVKSKED